MGVVYNVHLHILVIVTFSCGLPGLVCECHLEDMYTYVTCRIHITCMLPQVSPHARVTADLDEQSGPSCSTSTSTVQDAYILPKVFVDLYI